MHDLFVLISPRLLSARNAFSRSGRGGTGIRLAVFGLLGLIFWVGILAVSLKVLGYFKSVEQLGALLSFKLLSMMFITLLSLLVFSSILTHLAKLFLSRDLSLVHALPVASRRIYLARWMESTFDSAWMVVVYTLPVFTAFGIVFKGGVLYYLTTLSAMASLAVAASGLSALVVMAAVVLVPASRMRNIFVLLGLVVFVLLFLFFRLLRPERLVDPEVFSTVLLYLSALKTPDLPFLPSTWAYDSLRAALAGAPGEALFNTALCWSFAMFIVFTSVAVADWIYFRGMSKAQAGARRTFRPRSAAVRRSRLLSQPVSAFLVKELKSFFRDQTQWSQLFLLGALVLIYVFNFKALPLDKAPINTLYLQNLLSFLNMGLAAFVLIAVTGRFGFPAVSSENEAFWLVQAAPISIRQFLWIKFCIYVFPLLLLTEILIVVTNIFLNVTPFMMVLSTVSVLLMVPGVIGIGVGLGAIYPNFRAENPAQVVTSFGGLMFMVLSALFVGLFILLEAGPVYTLFMADLNRRPLVFLEWLWVGASFFLAGVLCLVAMIVPMGRGTRSLADTHS